MVQTLYFKVFTGNIYSILSTFECDRAMQVNELDKFIETVGATKGRWASQGTLVSGLYFGPMAKPKGWRPMGKTLRGYFRPDTRNAQGKVYKAALEKLHMLTGEDLAHRLKLPPFFDTPEGGWCTSVECNMVGGCFFLQAPAAMLRAMTALGAHEITKTEHDQAMAQKKAAT